MKQTWSDDFCDLCGHLKENDLCTNPDCIEFGWGLVPEECEDCDLRGEDDLCTEIECPHYDITRALEDGFELLDGNY